MGKAFALAALAAAAFCAALDRPTGRGGAFHVRPFDAGRTAELAPFVAAFFWLNSLRRASEPSRSSPWDFDFGAGRFACEDCWLTAGLIFAGVPARGVAAEVAAASAPVVSIAAKTKPPQNLVLMFPPFP